MNSVRCPCGLGVVHGAGAAILARAFTGDLRCRGCGRPLVYRADSDGPDRVGGVVSFAFPSEVSAPPATSERPS